MSLTLILLFLPKQKQHWNFYRSIIFILVAVAVSHQLTVKKTLGESFGCPWCAVSPGSILYGCNNVAQTPPVDVPTVSHSYSAHSLPPLVFFLPLLSPFLHPLYLFLLFFLFLSFCLIYHLSTFSPSLSLSPSLPTLSFYPSLPHPLSRSLYFSTPGSSLLCRCAVATPFNLAPLWD